MKQNTIRLTESQLHRVIKESVKQFLQEENMGGVNEQVVDTIVQNMEQYIEMTFANGGEFPQVLNTLQYIVSHPRIDGQQISTYLSHAISLLEQVADSLKLENTYSNDFGVDQQTYGQIVKFIIGIWDRQPLSIYSNNRVTYSQLYKLLLGDISFLQKCMQYAEKGSPVVPQVSRRMNMLQSYSKAIQSLPQVTQNDITAICQKLNPQNNQQQY